MFDCLVKWFLLKSKTCQISRSRLITRSSVPRGPLLPMPSLLDCTSYRCFVQVHPEVSNTGDGHREIRVTRSNWVLYPTAALWWYVTSDDLSHSTSFIFFFFQGWPHNFSCLQKHSQFYSVAILAAHLWNPQILSHKPLSGLISCCHCVHSHASIMSQHVHCISGCQQIHGTVLRLAMVEQQA